MFPRQLGLINIFLGQLCGVLQISVSLSSFSEGKNVTMTSLKAFLVWIFFSSHPTPCPLQFLLDHWYFLASAGMWLHRAAVGHFLQDRPARECLDFFDARLTSPGNLRNDHGSRPTKFRTWTTCHLIQAWVFSKNRSVQVECC